MNSFFDDKHQMLMLVDAHAIIYRAYFALPPTLTTPEGMLVNAAFGFTRILLTAIRDMKPTYLSVVFDHPDPTFRHKEFADYKAHREKMPDDLIPQIGLTKEIVKNLNIPQFEMAGFEADDLIGTLSQQATTKTVIVTGDQDMFQLVNDKIHVWLPPRGKHPADEYDLEKVYQKIGVYPEQVIDMKALMGDSSDNIPGIKGIGPKSAVALLREFKTLAGVYKAVSKAEKYPNILKGALLKKLQTGEEVAFLSQKLATIEQAVPIKLDLESCRVTGYNKSEAVKLFQELEFRSLINLLPNDEFETSIQDSLF
ncbi:MAG: 5'-3' exonuclease H3TH domain-containing protein [Patescibacteria group bacterium]